MIQSLSQMAINYFWADAITKKMKIDHRSIAFKKLKNKLKLLKFFI